MAAAPSAAAEPPVKPLQGAMKLAKAALELDAGDRPRVRGARGGGRLRRCRSRVRGNAWRSGLVRAGGPSGKAWGLLALPGLPLPLFPGRRRGSVPELSATAARGGQGVFQPLCCWPTSASGASTSRCLES